jgi:hypothetical protein
MANVAPSGGQFPQLSALEARLQSVARGKYAPMAGQPSRFWNPNSTIDPAVSPVYGYPNPSRLQPAPGQDETTANFPTRSGKYSEIPTSSSYTSRPRTVAAAYKPDFSANQGTLTVVFRDGTYYNYYDVRDTEWELFKGNLSKGPMLNPATKNNPVPGFLMAKPRGEADVTNVDADVMEMLHRTAQVSQLREPNRRHRDYTRRMSARMTPAKAPTATPATSLGRNSTVKGSNTATQGRRPRKP